jgi:outer membrane lipoprotein-sorting protein
MLRGILTATLVLAFAAAPVRAQQTVPLSLAPPAKPGAVKPGAGGPKTAAVPPGASLTPQEAIERANLYFNASPTMIGDFVQMSGGRRLDGKVYVQRPGRLRFEYAPPATLEVVSDGTSVAVRDRKLHTQDLYLIGQTPLKFLTKAQIDIARDTRVLDVKSDASAVSILLEDKATLGGTSRIKLIFDANSFALRQWVVNDPQGRETMVSLFNVDFNKKPDPALFTINTERILETPRR